MEYYCIKYYENVTWRIGPGPGTEDSVVEEDTTNTADSRCIPTLFYSKF